MVKQTKEVKIAYTPRNLDYHDSPARWKVLVCHRRWGKTTFAINHLIRDAMRTPNARFAYIAPYYKQAKAVAWDMLKQFSRPIPGIKINESELRIDYPGGSRIQLFGADNTDALRGLALWGVVFDEYSQQPASIFTEVIRPALSDHKGYAIWIGTPQGRNDFFRLYDENKNDPEWMCLLIRASESGIIDEEELMSARKGMSIDEYNQEFECSFDAAIKGAYYSAQLADARRENRVTIVPHQKGAKVHTFWDLGISDTTVIIFAQIAGREIQIIDYYENNGMDLEHYALELRKKEYSYGFHYLPHDIKVRELGTGRSRYEVLGKHLGKESLKVVPNLPVKDGIDAGRLLFNRMWFDEIKCQQLLDALGSYCQEWDDKKGMFRDKPLHNWASHPADAFRMLAVGLREKVEVSKSHGISSKYNRGMSAKNFNNLAKKISWNI